jgi:hypothetical protein
VVSIASRGGSAAGWHRISVCACVSPGTASLGCTTVPSESQIQFRCRPGARRARLYQTQSERTLWLVYCAKGNPNVARPCPEELPGRHRTRAPWPRPALRSAKKRTDVRTVEIEATNEIPQVQIVHGSAGSNALCVSNVAQVTRRAKSNQRGQRKLPR